MKASDVKFSLERALASPEVAEIISGINSVEVLDDYTVKVTTEKPNGCYFKQPSSHYYSYFK